MLHNTCNICGSSFGGESELETCMRCWELYEEAGGPQLDPDEYPPDTAK